jgi:hypothetical protein
LENVTIIPTHAVMAIISGLLVVGTYYNMWAIIHSAFHLTNLVKTWKGDMVTGGPGQLSDSGERAALRDDCSHSYFQIVPGIRWLLHT